MNGIAIRRVFQTLVAACVLAEPALAEAQGNAVRDRVVVNSSGAPHLQKQGTATQLIVDGKPFLIVGGELGNSTASSIFQLRKHWPRLKALNLNTVLVPVYWELIEPSEGKFNFATVDSLLVDARVNRMKLVLLWFGTWKNSMSTYVPEYIKTNQAKYVRVQATKGEGQDILSPFVEANVLADARAFSALMKHIGAVDARDHTVLMVQVENETGMIPTARDHSALADSLFAQAVPTELISYLQKNKSRIQSTLRAQWDAAGGKPTGSWEAVFGRSLATDELFMAWHFARYHERVTSAGKKEYSIPMFANAALIRPGYAPGRYVSAGPLPHLIDVWRAASPSTDFLAPDVYFPNFAEWSSRYASLGDAMFVPEAIASPTAAVNALFAIGKLNSIGFSPFSIENTDTSSTIARSFSLLRQIAPVVLANQGNGTVSAAMPITAFDGSVDASAQTFNLTGSRYTLTVNFADPPGPPSPSPGMPGAEGPVTVNAAKAAADVAQRNAPPRGAILVSLAPDEFLVAGTGVTVTFAPSTASGFAGIMRVENGHYVNGKWIRDSLLNGDQTHQGRHLAIYLNQYGMQRIKLYTYQ